MIRCNISNEITNQIRQMQQMPERVLQSVVSDFKSRAPGWVATEVTKVYNIKKQEIRPGQSNTRQAGNIAVRGSTVQNITLVYSGRLLTLTHFGMTPKAPKQTYTLKAEVKKGNKQTLGKIKKLTKKQRQNIGRNFTRGGTRSSSTSPVMLMGAGSTYIPFQRRSQNRKNIVAIKTVSVPQMIENEAVRTGIDAAINTNIQKRMQHYIDRYMP